jgi:hypothetical protein
MDGAWRLHDIAGATVSAHGWLGENEIARHGAPYGKGGCISKQRQFQKGNNFESSESQLIVISWWDFVMPLT